MSEQAMMYAIARMEGYGADQRNIPTRHNNPGDIEAGKFANAHGAIPNAPDPASPERGPSRYAVFPTAQAGWQALRALLVAHYAGKTLRECIHVYAPPCENDTDRYVRQMCLWTGLAANTILTPENIG